MTEPSRNRPCPCGSGKKYKRCCGSNPGNVNQRPASHAHALRQLVESAIAALDRGHLDEANRLCDRALVLAPTDPAVLGIKGMVAYRADLQDEAEQLIRRGIEVNPKDSRLHNFLGQVLVAQGDHIEAERAFGQAISLDPHFVEAWFNIGTTQLLMHRPDEAIRSLQQVLHYVPNDGETHLHLAKSYYLKRQLTEAEHALNHAVRLGVKATRADLLRCLVLRSLGRFEEAQTIEAQINESGIDAEGLFQVLTEFGRMETHVGNMKEARYWLEKAIALRPERPKPYVELASAHKFTEADRPLVEKMESILPTLDEASARGMEFALGKVYTDLGDYDGSFTHYQAANAIVRRKVPFKRDSYVAEVTRIIDFFTAERLAQLPAGSDSPMPIIIIGTPRSGTTLTEQIISSHSQVAGAGEMDFWPRLGDGLIKAYSEKLAQQLANQYLAHMRQHSATARHITDKMPGNYKHLGLLHAVFPNARIVHCRRHPIDACLSIYFQNFPDGHAYKWDLDSLVVFYEQYIRLMDHWRTVLPPGTLFELQYENLVEDIEGVSRHLMDFLGLEWEEGILEYYKQDRAVFTASVWQARQPVYKSSKERWRRYEQHLGPLLGLLKYVPKA